MAWFNACLAFMVRFSPPARTKPCAVGETEVLRVPNTEEVQRAQLGPASGAELCRASLPAVPSLPCSSGLKNHQLIYLGQTTEELAELLDLPLRLPPHFSGAFV